MCLIRTIYCLTTPHTTKTQINTPGLRASMQAQEAKPRQNSSDSAAYCPVDRFLMRQIFQIGKLDSFAVSVELNALRNAPPTLPSVALVAAFYTSLAKFRTN